MSLTEQIITIAIAAVATMMTRFVPFIIFKNSAKTPLSIKKIGNFLPAAVLGILVVYCYKDVVLSFDKTALVSILAGIVTAICHLWKRNMFLSIFVGTLIYMLLYSLV